MDDVKQMDNEQLRTQANETIVEWDDIEAHLGTQNKASIGLFHSRSDDIRVMLEEAVKRLELAGSAPLPTFPREEGDTIILGPEIFADREGDVICWRGENYVKQFPVEAAILGDAAEKLDGLIGGLRGRIDGGTIMELLMAAQAVYGLVLNAPGFVSQKKREDLSEQALRQAEEERRVIEEVRDAAPEVEEATPDERQRIIAEAMQQAEEPAAFPEGTEVTGSFLWHAIAVGPHGTVEAKAYSNESGPDPDESKRLFEEMWEAYEAIYNDVPNSISVNVEVVSG